jgi:hypothetical protein
VPPKRLEIRSDAGVADGFAHSPTTSVEMRPSWTHSGDPVMRCASLTMTLAVTASLSGDGARITAARDQFARVITAPVTVEVGEEFSFDGYVIQAKWEDHFDDGGNLIAAVVSFFVQQQV